MLAASDQSQTWTAYLAAVLNNSSRLKATKLQEAQLAKENH